MSEEKVLVRAHPEGEQESAAEQVSEGGGSVDTFAGKIQVKWVPEAAVSSLGQMPYFIEFLKTSGLFDKWVEECPLEYRSPNAPRKRDVLGTVLLSVLSGHWRYAHISAIRGDGVNPDLLGMEKVASEDSVRRALIGMKEEKSEGWMKRHLKASYWPLLEEPWILDMDSTVKPLYGHQQDAVVGYNPAKPGRPSHVYHSYFIANLRMVLEVEVQAGNQTASWYAQPDLWELVDGLEEKRRPAFLRGDCAWGTERAMVGAEERKIPYVFKLKQSAKVKKLIGQLFGADRWVGAGQGWEGVDADLKLEGWSRTRRVVALRRPKRQAKAEVEDGTTITGKAAKQLVLDLPEAAHMGALYEYAVLVTSMRDEVWTIAQHYRDRGDSENNFDELKNQWGWAGFTTHDRKRCQIMARIVALNLQLVDDLHAAGNPGQACRGGDVAPAGVARHRPADAAQQSNHGGNHEPAFQSRSDRGRSDEGEHVSQVDQDSCGAVDPTRTVASDPECRVSGFPSRQGPWKHWPLG